jgi:nucleoside-triphosphatase THEP1
MVEKFTGQILLVTGARDSGKTTLCRRMVDIARKANWQVKGLVSPAIIKGDVKVGIGVEDLGSGKRFMLARLAEEGDSDALLRTPKWIFDERCITWCNSVLEQAAPADLLVVDELGPLELEKNSGWTAALPLIDGKKYHLAIVVVCDEFLTTLQERWPAANTVTMTGANQIERIMENVIDLMMPKQKISGEG